MQKNDFIKDFLLKCKVIKPDINIQAIHDIVIKTIHYYSKSRNAQDPTPISQELEKQWYDSLSSGSPDYNIYESDYYLAEVFSCWIVYSRRYILSLLSDSSLNDMSIIEDMQDVKSVLDIGCGLGYTTCALAEIFQNADVYALDIPETMQYQYAKLLSKEHQFTMLNEDRQIDLIFASEYFEHMYAPIDHLKDILKKYNPKYLIIANAFGTRAIGHFNSYNVNGFNVSSKDVSKMFNNALRQAGYMKMKTNLWNDRPAYWKKQIEQMQLEL